MKKYSWFTNHADSMSYTIIFKDKEDSDEVYIALTDSVDNAELIVDALNKCYPPKKD